jgi:hypothetical protein
MAYCIFLKSLRSVEEFRKNPCVQIPPKFPCANFQSLGKFKNPIFNPNILFPIHLLLPAQLALPAHLAFGPPSPTGLPSPQDEAFLTSPSGPCVDGVSVEVCFPFRFTPSKLVTFSLPLSVKWTSLVRSFLSPVPADPSQAATSIHHSRLSPSPRSTPRDAASVP